MFFFKLRYFHLFCYSCNILLYLWASSSHPYLTSVHSQRSQWLPELTPDPVVESSLHHWTSWLCQRNEVIVILVTVIITCCQAEVKSLDLFSYAWVVVGVMLSFRRWVYKDRHISLPASPSNSCRDWASDDKLL